MLKILVVVCLIIAAVMAWRSGVRVVADWIGKRPEVHRRLVLMGVETVSLFDLLMALAISAAAILLYWAFDAGYLPLTPI